MTPWGIRKKLKSLVGGGIARAEEPEQVAVTLVLPDGSNHTVHCEPRYTLVMASQAIETPIATGCPDGACGGCNVEILEGMDKLTTPSAAEQAILDAKWAHRPGTRLACHAKVLGSGAKVKVNSIWTMDNVRGS